MLLGGSKRQIETALGTSPQTPAAGDKVSPIGLTPPTTVSECEFLCGAAFWIGVGRYCSGLVGLLGCCLRSRRMV